MHRKRMGFLIALGITIVLSFGISELLSALRSDPEGIEIRNSRKLRNPKFWPRMDEQFSDIFWITQVSDIHLSLFNDPHRGPDLIRLCQEYFKLIDPQTVIVTGDLTSARMKGSIKTKQFKEEWINYQSIIAKCSSVMKAKWVDIRGNHDCFDVIDHSSKNNFFRLFSGVGPILKNEKKLEQGFVHNVVRPDRSVYSFVGLDACSRPGPNKPLNYFGYLDENQSQHLKYLSALTAHSNHTIWFGHYPTSFIVQNPPRLREIMRGSIMYLCGHLHTLWNLVPRMYAKHRTGQLELELGDWKDNRIFRIIVFDHDLVSFVDAKLGQWPIILITNPKDSKFLSPLVEPVEMIAYSTHIRILVFSRIKVKSLYVHIDKQFQGIAKQANLNSPLYVLKWNPKRFAKGTHKIAVTVMTADKNTVFLHQHFSVDGEEVGLGLVPRLLLMLNIYTVGKSLFGFLVLAYVTVLTILNQISHIRPFLLQGRQWYHVFLNRILVGAWLGSKVTLLFYLLVGSVLYLAFGPWFFGYLLTDHIGVVFAWGIIINGTFIPGGQTYMYALFQFLTFTVPLTLLVGHILEQRHRQAHKFLLRRNVLTLLLLSFLFYFTITVAFGEFLQAYGWITFVLGPLRTGNIFLLPLAVWLALSADLETINTSTV